MNSSSDNADSDTDILSDSLVCDSAEAIWAEVRSLQEAGETVGFVPTMGALHEGHLSLVREAQRHASRVIVSIFVNPTQFAAGEDLDRYPRSLKRDVELLRELDVRRIFVPQVSTMYPPGFTTFVDPPALARGFEGEARPTFFRGVATIVLKLFHIVPADVAVFGQKDYQQACVIKAMVRDLNLPIRIEVAPTVRENNGLAMSSRNAYLQGPDHRRALALNEALEAAAKMLESGERDVSEVEKRMRQVLEAAPVDSVDYASVVSADTLQPLDQLTGKVVAMIAAKVGETRLIDNRIFEIGSAPSSAL